jgi:hypothetical protein
MESEIAEKESLTRQGFPAQLLAEMGSLHPVLLPLSDDEQNHGRGQKRRKPGEDQKKRPKKKKKKKKKRRRE